MVETPEQPQLLLEPVSGPLGRQGQQRLHGQVTRLQGHGGGEGESNSHTVVRRGEGQGCDAATASP